MIRGRSMAMVAGLLLLTGCSGAGTAPPPASSPPGPVTAEVVPPARDPHPPPPAATTTTTTTAAVPEGRPEWLGKRPLPLRPDGFGEVLPTPPELVDRRLPTPALLPPPEGAAFEWTIQPVPAGVAARSTWTEECPIPLDDLRYLTVSFFGFEERFHRGELIVHAEAVDGVVEVFRRLHAERFPIEEMRVIRADELDLPPTGDGNVTTGFVCRPAVGSSSWSRHALGLAVDINPFHNPYLKGDLVLPELASAYVDREWVRPGMILPGDPATQAFAEMGWHWGGEWRTLKDWMHFSADGR